MNPCDEDIAEIVQVQFGICRPDEIRRRSVVHVEFPETFENNNTTEPKIKGLTDPHMGPIDPKTPCESCGLLMEQCWGHFGHIEIARALYHPPFVAVVLKLLRIFCHNCSRLLVYPPDIPVNATLKDIEDMVKNKAKYARCGGAVKNAKTDDGEYIDWCSRGCGAVQFHYKKDAYDIYYKDPDGKKEEVHLFTAQRAKEVLERITDDDARIVGFTNPERCKPSWMIMTVLPVPPPAVRPSVLMDGSKRSDDDLSFKLAEIIKTNKVINDLIAKGATSDKIQEQTSLLQFHWASYIQNDFPKRGISTQRSNRPVKSLIDRLTGKQGRLRGHLMGKRGDQTARTVIGPDPFIGIDELGIPLQVAMTLTYPETVDTRNIHKMYRLVQNGPTKHPGACVITKRDGTEIDLRYRPTSITLDYGDVIHRHLENGDPVINNRQPSLHKMSMMGHYVKVMPYSTFRMNLAVTTPYNADFDGKLVAINSRLPCWFFDSPVRKRSVKSKIWQMTPNYITY